MILEEKDILKQAQTAICDKAAKWLNKLDVGAPQPHSKTKNQYPH